MAIEHRRHRHAQHPVAQELQALITVVAAAQGAAMGDGARQQAGIAKGVAQHLLQPRRRRLHGRGTGPEDGRPARHSSFSRANSRWSRQAPSIFR